MTTYPLLSAQPFLPPNPFVRVGRGQYPQAPPPVVDEQPYPEDRLRRREIEEAMLKNLRLEGLSRFVSAMTQLRPHWAAEDAALRVQLEEQLQNVAFGASGSTPLSISTVAQDDRQRAQSVLRCGARGLSVH